MGDSNLTVADGDKLYIGPNGSYITESSSDLTFYDPNVATTKTLTQLAAAGTGDLDTAFDGGNAIDGATTDAATGVQIGDGTNYVSIYEGNDTHVYFETSVGDIKFIAAGGDIDFADDNLTTQGAINIDADNVKFTIGDAQATDSYFQWDTANLEIYSYGSLELMGTHDTTNYITISTPSSVPTINTAGSNNLTIKSNSGTISFHDELLTTSGTVTAGTLTIGAGSVTDSSGAISFGNESLTTSGNVNIDSDSNKLYFGDGQTSYIYDTGTNLTFYDNTYGATVTLSQLASANLNNPTVTGDLTISDGTLDWADASDEVAGTWSFAGTTNNDITWTSSCTTGCCLHITADDLDSGSMIFLDTDQALAGEFLVCYDGAANVLAIKRYGEIEIAGNAGADMVTIAAGDLQVDNGKFEIDTTQNIGCYIKRNNATGAVAVLEIEQSHATGGVGLLVDQDATGDVNAIEITNAGTGYAVTTTAAAAGGEGFEYIAAASGTGVAFRGDGSTGSWIGATDVGMIDLDTDGALAGGANLLRLDCTGTNAQNSFVCEILSSGNIAGATDGSLLNIVESGGAQATTYCVRIASTNNEALHVDTGVSLFDETVTVSIADNAGIDAFVVDQNDATQNKDGIVITTAGTGKALKATVETATGGGIHFIGAANQTTSLVTIDGTTGDWLGAADVGMLHLHGDGTHADADASMVYMDFNGTAAANQLGVCLHMDLAGATAGGGTEYAMYINSPTAGLEALKIDAGAVVVDETLQASGGLLTIYSENDVTDPPTQVEMDTAFAAGAEALNGMLGVINDANGGANVWLCVCADGAWYYAAKLTIGT